MAYFWIELDRLVVVLRSRGHARPCREGEAAADVDDGIFWVELDRLVVVLGGTVEVALGPVGGAAAKVGDGIFRVELDRLVVSLNCTVEHLSQQISRQPADEKLRHESVPDLSYRRIRLRRPVALDKGLSLGPVSPHARNRGGSRERKEKHRGRALEPLAPAGPMARGQLGLVARGNEFAFRRRQPVRPTRRQCRKIRPLGPGCEMLGAA